MSNHPTHYLLLDLQAKSRWSCRTHDEFMLNWNQATPLDRLMQRVVWMYVRYALWDGLTFVQNPRGRPLAWEPNFWDGRELLRGIIVMPTEPQYYALVGTGKVLISLATDLDVDDVVKMEVAKVVNLTAEGDVQVACVVSLDQTIIVTVDKRSSQAVVTHTQPLEFSSGGVKALIATLSPIQSHPAYRISNNTPLPVEIVENAFRFLFLTGDKPTIANFACTCKLFAEIVRFCAVRIGHCLVLNLLTARAGEFLGLDEKVSVVLYRFDCDYE